MVPTNNKRGFFDPPWASEREQIGTRLGSDWDQTGSRLGSAGEQTDLSWSVPRVFPSVPICFWKCSNLLPREFQYLLPGVFQPAFPSVPQSASNLLPVCFPFCFQFCFPFCFQFCSPFAFVVTAATVVPSPALLLPIICPSPFASASARTLCSPAGVQRSSWFTGTTLKE